MGLIAAGVSITSRHGPFHTAHSVQPPTRVYARLESTIVPRTRYDSL